MRTRLALMAAAALVLPSLAASPVIAAPPADSSAFPKAPPTKPGEIPKYIDAYTPGMMKIDPLDIPADVMARLKDLPADKIDFLKSGKTSSVIPSSQLFRQIRETSSPRELADYVDTVMTVYGQMQFHKGVDPETIPFDTTSPRFNDWRLRRPAELDPHREPGPIQTSRYMHGYSTGLPTFAGSPIALTPEDLKAGKVDVAIMGAPLDMGSGWRDAQHGPNAIRVMRDGTGGTEVSSMIAPSEVLNIVDYGNAAVDQNSTERSVQEVRRMVGEIGKAGSIPVVIGGDHSLEYPDVAAMADVYGKGQVGVIHFDSHLDTGRGRIHLLDHGQPIYRAMKEGHIRPEDYIQVGIRAHYSKDYYEWERLIGMRYHTMAEVEKHGWDAVMERAIQEAKKNTKYLWISFDVDVLDPAFEPGTGTPVAGGLTMREAIPIMRRLCSEANVVGFDIVELAPALDPTYRSALNANTILFSCLTGIAMRKKGITQANYFSPLSSEHGQDKYYATKGKGANR
ncbi:agmatinase family protein [Gluconacetobacter azotocaptans]|uniref:Agmatinase family protein n=1 Tax=Gluconacetobacter azotocaptans TaxID=142834 RepID=A0A7W4JV58_9PROT|nr:agmatinase family protein [Gluconacetobacter azotocaptans]MBB2191479.1 agmatinase family protein [Gluconacetobacter azotocaptans]